MSLTIKGIRLVLMILQRNTKPKTELFRVNSNTSSLGDGRNNWTIVVFRLLSRVRLYGNGTDGHTVCRITVKRLYEVHNPKPFPHRFILISGTP